MLSATSPRTAFAESRSQPNRDLGQQLAASTLTQVSLPDGSSRTGRAFDQVLTYDPGHPGTDDLVQEHRFWLIPLSLDDTMSFLDSHMPTGTKRGGYGNVGTADTQEFDLSTVPPGIYSASLTETVVSLSAHQSELRLDAQVVWVPTRSPIEHVGSDIKAATITRTPGMSTTPAGLQPTTVTVTDPQQLSTLAQIFNGLVAVPSLDCVGPPETTYRVAFSTAGNTKPTIVAQGGLGGACGGFSVTVWSYAATPPRWQAAPKLATGKLIYFLDLLTISNATGGIAGSVGSH